MRTEMLNVHPIQRVAVSADTTVSTFGAMWTSGDLYRRYPNINSLKIKQSAAIDIYRLRRYVDPLIGSKRVADVSETDIELVMSRVPTDRRAATRMRVYNILHRLFDLAIVPGRLRTTNPVSAYVRPARDTEKLYTYLFPQEFLALIGCAAIPLELRVLYCLATYTGLRRGSLLALRWSDVDFEHGTVTSRTSKTGLAVMFSLTTDVLALLRAWRERCGHGKKGDLVVVAPPQPSRLAKYLRRDLARAGVHRAGIYHREASVQPLRFHDLRATFVTWAKRAGKGDGWVSDRTGHLTGAMLRRYDRAARTLADLNISPFPDVTGRFPDLPIPVPAAHDTLNPLAEGSSPSWPTVFVADFLRAPESKDRAGVARQRRQESPSESPSGTLDDRGGRARAGLAVSLQAHAATFG
jgi:integrase